MDLAGARPAWSVGDIDRFRDELRDWLAANWDTSITVREWWKRLAGAGLTAPTWPKAHGGLAATTKLQQVVEEELGMIDAVAPPLGGDGVRLVGPALRHHGSTAQLAEVLPPLLTGQQRWALLLYEGESSDPADISCRSEFDWKYVFLHGTKRLDDTGDPTHAAVLTRSEESTGRDGLTWLLVDLALDGVRIESGQIRFDATRMMPERVIGTRGDGWSVVKTLAPFLQGTLAGRIRRGLVHVEPGSRSGDLDLSVAEAIARRRPPVTPPVERRQR